MSHAYTEDQVVKQPAIRLAALGWRTVSAMEETLDSGGILGRETRGEMVLVDRRIDGQIAMETHAYA